MNKTAQFTPGPWALEYDVDGIPLTIIGNDGSAIGTIETWNDHAEGNRHIITAAPAMYEALKGALVNMNRLGDKRSAYRAMWISQVEAALAQAEGRHHE